MSRTFRLCVLVAVLCCTASISVDAMNSEQQGKRVALVIGNSTYANAPPLRNPVNDAREIAKALTSFGFEVVLGTDLAHRDVAKTVRSFAKTLKNAETALFFYAGHGLQVNGVNYLIPVDARLGGEEDLEFEALRLERIIELMERVPRNLIFLDACRDNPLTRSLARSMGTRSVSIGRGLAKMDVRAEAMISFATEPGQVALDGTGSHSPFTAALLKHIATPNLDIAFLMRRVRKDVKEATQQRQIPWHNSSLTAPFTFYETATETTGTVPPPVPPAQRIDDQAVEIAYWNSIATGNNAAAFEAYLKRFPNGVFAKLAKLKLEEIAKKDELPRKRAARKEQTDNKICPSGTVRDKSGNCIPARSGKRQTRQRKAVPVVKRKETKKNEKSEDNWRCQAIWGRKADAHCN